MINHKINHNCRPIAFSTAVLAPSNDTDGKIDAMYAAKKSIKQ